MGMDACAKLLFGFPIIIEDNDELVEAIEDGQFPFVWKNPAEYADDIYIQLTDFYAGDYTAECLGRSISSNHKYNLFDIEEFCKKYNIPYQSPQWYLIPYFF
jgi:hypothetical protein